MSAATKAEQGASNKAAVEKALGVRLQSAEDIASKAKLTKGTVIRHLKALVGAGRATSERVGRSVGYKKAA